MLARPPNTHHLIFDPAVHIYKIMENGAAEIMK